MKCPVRFRSWFLPPPNADWHPVRYQPILYTFVWVGALITWIFGASDPPIANPTIIHLAHVWLVPALLSPMMGLLSMWMITRGSGTTRYWGFWLRLGANLGMGFALADYCIFRFAMGNLYLTEMMCLAASTLFVMHLIGFDIQLLRTTEKVARRIHRENGDGPQED